MAVSWKILLNVVEKSPFTLSKVVRQQFMGEVDKFIVSGVIKFLHDAAV